MNDDIRFEVYDAKGIYEDAFVERSVAIKAANKLCGYVRRIPVTPDVSNPIADFRIQGVTKPPPGAPAKEEREPCGDEIDKAYAFVVCGYGGVGQPLHRFDSLRNALHMGCNGLHGSVIRSCGTGRMLWKFPEGRNPDNMPSYCVCEFESFNGYIQCYQNADAAAVHAEKIKGFVLDIEDESILWDYREKASPPRRRPSMTIEDRRSNSHLVNIGSLIAGQAFEFGASKLLRIEDGSFLDLSSLTRFKTGEDGMLVVCADDSEYKMDVAFGTDDLVHPINIKFVIED